MSRKMLIDAAHPEETRVVIVDNNRVEEFDFESASKKPIRGNIYLAKVTRVEPSLQAAFVEYGGNKHGFLAFNEIHPDYYQIPHEDRAALREAEAEVAADLGEDAGSDEENEDAPAPDEDDLIDEAARRRRSFLRKYKIQEVIKRRQVLLVQVAKEERGNKGAALTTYLSLAGRYCVLMPNSSHGGGISRKISSGSDRKRLKSIVSDLSLPKSMGLIVRTAGLSRTKTEIKRDFDYLARLWDEIRERTMSSSAPAQIHSDSDLIKRAIRDIYNREIEEVVVEGEEGYKAAKAFMKLLMPSHARRVKNYNDPVPLFQRYGAEDQLSAMYDPMVQLKSGGYLIINPTEALVSIDINSGRSTKEHGIEQTALHTNLEAAKEIARQLRLRDMAGLVVIDFIDMERTGNVRKVERCMKDALKNDRARIQVGRISGFGLMEMSRQRLRTGVLEATTRECPHCDGTGLVRTASSAGLSALRLIEDEAAKGKGTVITLFASTEAAVYLLNAKRADLAEIEQRYGVTVEVKPEGEDEGAKMRVTSSGPRPAQAPKFEPIVDDDDDDVEDDDYNDTSGEDDDDNGEQPKKRRRRRRGGRGRNKSRQQDEDQNEPSEDGDDDNDDADASSSDGNDDEGDGKPRRRRGRRGGRGRNRSRQDNDSSASGDDQSSDEADAPDEPQEAVAKKADAPEEAKPEAEEKPKPKRTRRKKAEPAETEEAKPEGAEAEEKPKPKRTRRKKAEPAETDEATAEEAKPADAKPEAEEKPKPKRTRRKKAEPAAETEGEAEAEGEPAAKPAKKTVKAEAPANDGEQAEGEQPEGDGATNEDGSPRRGWWQRTFGN